MTEKANRDAASSVMLGLAIFVVGCTTLAFITGGVIGFVLGRL